MRPLKGTRVQTHEDASISSPSGSQDDETKDQNGSVDNFIQDLDDLQNLGKAQVGHFSGHVPVYETNTQPARWRARSESKM